MLNPLIPHELNLLLLPELTIQPYSQNGALF